MSEGRFVATVAINDSLAAHDDGRFVDHLDGPVRVHHLGGVNEAGIPIVVLLVELRTGNVLLLFIRTPSKLA